MVNGLGGVGWHHVSAGGCTEASVAVILFSQLNWMRIMILKVCKEGAACFLEPRNSIDFPSVATLSAAALAVIAVYGAFVLTTINLILVAARTKPSEDLRFKPLASR